MNSKRKTGLVLIVIFTMSVIFTMTARGAVEVQTKTISQTSDDGWVTEVGNLFDSQLTHILDPDMDIRSFVVFRDIKINKWERLENATLILKSANVLALDTSSVTIWGISRVAHYLPIDAADVISVPLTSSNVVADTSFFYGGATLEIDVTNILRELMSHPDWTGDGSDGTGSGEKIGFLILGAEGHATRVFYDEIVGNGLEARIRIYWGETPAPPSTDAPGGFNDTSVYTWILENSTVPFEGDGDYNETVDIWRVDAFGEPEIQYVGIVTGGDAYYHKSTTGTGGSVSLGSGWTFSEGGFIDPIISVDPYVLVMGDPGQLFIYLTDDEFTTNISVNINDLYNLAPWAGNMGSIFQDRVDTSIFHAVWTSPSPAFPGNFNVIYTNFSIDMSPLGLTFSPTYTNLTQVAWSQNFPTGYCQNNGTLHVVWYGEQGSNDELVWYRRRLPNGTWLDQVQVSDTDVAGDPHARADVIANEETGVALIVWEHDRTNVFWDVVYPNNTDDVDRLANTGVVPAMVNDRDTNIAQLVWSSSIGQPATIYHQTKLIDNSTAWSANMQVSPGGEKHWRPDVGIETVNGTVMTIWQNDWNNRVAGNYWNIGTAPTVGKDTINNLDLSDNFIENEFVRTIINTTYFVVWGNGTVISGPLDSLDAVDDFLDEFFGIDPEEPNPPSQGWPGSGVLTRFKTRFYILFIGFIMIFGPLINFAMSRPDGYTFTIGCFIMLIGFALWIAAGSV